MDRYKSLKTISYDVTYKWKQVISKQCILTSIEELSDPWFVLQAMAIINGFLYVFGGTTGYIYSTDLHRLDLTTREWIHLKPNNPPDDLPEER